MLIEAESPEKTRQVLHISARDKYKSHSVIEVWVAKALARFSITRRQPVAVGELPKPATKSQVVLVQYFDLCTEPADEIDGYLKCPRLRWARDVEEVQGGKEFRRYFDIFDVSTVRGVVHVVRGDYELGISKSHACEDDRHWSKQWFYLNRFKNERRGATVSVEVT